MQTVVFNGRQTVLDIVLQNYGTIDGGILMFIQDNDLSLSSLPASGQAAKIREDKLDPKTVSALKIIVSQ